MTETQLLACLAASCIITAMVILFGNYTNSDGWPPKHERLCDCDDIDPAIIHDAGSGRGPWCLICGGLDPGGRARRQPDSGSGGITDAP